MLRERVALSIYTFLLCEPEHAGGIGLLDVHLYRQYLGRSKGRFHRVWKGIELWCGHMNRPQQIHRRSRRRDLPQQEAPGSACRMAAVSAALCAYAWHAARTIKNARRRAALLRNRSNMGVFIELLR